MASTSERGDVIVGAPPDAPPGPDEEVLSDNRMITQQHDSSPPRVDSRALDPLGGIGRLTDLGPEQTQTADDSDQGTLTTADLVKVFEITLAEIRSSQTLALSVLGFSVACGAIIQKMHVPGGSNNHADISFVCWAVGVGLCAVGAGLIAYTRSHHMPLEDFIVAAGSGKSKSVLNNLRGALNKANISLRWTHWYRLPIVIGIILVVFAVGCEVYSDMPR